MTSIEVQGTSIRAREERRAYWLPSSLPERLLTQSLILSVALRPTGPSLRINEMRARIRDADMEQRFHVAAEFARSALSRDGVRDVFLTEVDSDFRVTAIVDGPDLETELTLRALFVSLVRQLSDSSVGHLTVISADDEDAQGPDLGISLSS